MTGDEALLAYGTELSTGTGKVGSVVAYGTEVSMGTGKVGSVVAYGTDVSTGTGKEVSVAGGVDASVVALSSGHASAGRH